MLVLSRGQWESVVITLEDGRKIVVRVTSCERGRCKLAFDCDRNIEIYRAELLVEEGTDGSVP